MRWGTIDDLQPSPEPEPFNDDYELEVKLEWRDKPEIVRYEWMIPSLDQNGNEFEEGVYRPHLQRTEVLVPLEVKSG